MDFAFYSPGPSARDHGGRFGSWLDVRAGTADLCLDMSSYGMSCAIRTPRVGIMARFISWVRSVMLRL